MPKNGILIEELEAVIRSAHDDVGWSLCVGSGISVPIFPDWFQLVDIMIKSLQQEYPNIRIDIERLKSMGFSADAIIQALKNMLNISEKEFLLLMSNSLYSNLMHEIGETRWKLISKTLENSYPAANGKIAWRSFIEIRDRLFKETTANLLAKVILEAKDNGIAPNKILTFNAESLLLALINSYVVEKTIGFNMDSAGYLNKVCDKIIDSTRLMSKNRISYIHCHGVLPVPGLQKNVLKIANKLVFTENEYLQLSNNAFSWQSNNFINTCMNQRVVFIGVSLTDPNMRKWLGWIHQNKLDEYFAQGKPIEESTQHFWIKTLPKTTAEKLWYESLVSHLGVRIIWIHEWKQAGFALRKMLGLYKRDKIKRQNKGKYYRRKYTK